MLLLINISQGSNSTFSLDQKPYIALSKFSHQPENKAVLHEKIQTENTISSSVKHHNYIYPQCYNRMQIFSPPSGPVQNSRPGTEVADTEAKQLGQSPVLFKLIYRLFELRTFLTKKSNQVYIIKPFCKIRNDRITGKPSRSLQHDTTVFSHFLILHDLHKHFKEFLQIT